MSTGLRGETVGYTGHNSCLVFLLSSIEAGVVDEFGRCLGLVCGVPCTTCQGSFDLILQAMKALSCRLKGSGLHIE